MLQNPSWKALSFDFAHNIVHFMVFLTTSAHTDTLSRGTSSKKVTMQVP